MSIQTNRIKTSFQPDQKSAAALLDAAKLVSVADLSVN
jgi:hypothetical protein